ncbi:MAG: uracil-DNA glycosylase [Gammaproteobacteria bacterium RIFCSPHIGHO2_12_FULL_38_11]|nr:MAG: uracil-DNA glycosylase [Gammaproteobacteria bacterium RIFCSPHIGHO2_12_FULL_38_11]
MIDWITLLSQEKEKPYFQAIFNFLENELHAGKKIYPATENIFNAIHYTDFANLKVVIIGQDPYHNPNQAHGLSFSVPKGVALPPSLINIFKELNSDCAIVKPTHGCLKPWAKQGVLLLNSVLTVEENKPGSHANIGWQQFTDTIIKQINQHPEKIIYLLWGSHAQKKALLIDQDKHTILTAPHPSPLSAYRGFLGCGHFSKVNKLLIQSGRTPINWNLK